MRELYKRHANHIRAIASKARRFKACPQSVVFGAEHLNAHSRWGQYTHLAAKVAAYHLGCWLNDRLGRPRGALETLLT